jgi:hypothetical protein
VNRKNSKFLVRCNESGVIFKPFVLVGNFEEDAVAIIMNRISLARRRMVVSRAIVRVRSLKGAISFDIMKT